MLNPSKSNILLDKFWKNIFMNTGEKDTNPLKIFSPNTNAFDLQIITLNTSKLQ